MRKLCVLVAMSAIAIGIFGVGPASAKTKKPVQLDGQVNAKGTKDVSKSTTATLELEQDDYYFSPTYIKVQPGEKVTLKIKNEGNASHTFTSTALNVDQTLSPDSSKKITVTIPTSGNVFQFHCNFHQSMGMQGAFYTSTASTTATVTPMTAAP